MIQKSIANVWHDKTIAETLQRLNTSVYGLDVSEVKRRRKLAGQNELPRAKKLTHLAIFFSQFKNTLVYILLIAAFISFFLGEHIDAYVILFAIFINVIVGYVQENKAQQALAELQSVVVPKALVIRQGSKRLIVANNLVPGDIIVLQAGSLIPADARLLEAHDLEMEEAALTGESAPVAKQIKKLLPGKALADRTNMVYMGTLVSHGVGLAVVTGIGIHTEIGQIAQMLSDTKDEPTPLQLKLKKFSRKLGFIILGICGVIFVIGIWQELDIIFMFNTAVAIAVAAIPEGLVVAVTVILAIGMQRVLKHKALVKKLIAAETLGSTTVICTDKTGTLTLGEMRVVKVVAFDKVWDVVSDFKKNFTALHDIMNTLKIATICNDAEFDQLGQPLGSATEKALLLIGSQMGLSRQRLETKTPRLVEIPFDSVYKFMATINKLNSKRKIVYVKGAPEYLLSQAVAYEKNGIHKKLDKAARQKIKQSISNLTKQQLRVIAVGYREVSMQTAIDVDNALDKLVWVGLLAMKDPLRHDSSATIAAVAQAGVRTVMITGDNRETAKSIGAELGLSTSDDAILEGAQLLELNDKQLAKIVKNISIYARVTPRDKLRIVKAWQSHGDVVAMTGDGINDAPALKQADIGVAVGSGTDVTKATADLVLLNNNYSALVAAVEQGRVIYDNIKKVVVYLLSDSFSEVLLIMGSLILGWPLPLLPAQILWINLVTDGFPHMALTLEDEEKEIMSEPPQEREKPILDTERNILIFTISTVTAIASLFIFQFYYKVYHDIDLARTVVFASLGIDSLLYVFSCRSLRHSIFNKQLFSNKYLLGAVGLGLLVQLV
ncbi:MAG: hypothetical protein CO073_05045, partial [Candidatus Komeilibacteria bacterium CG_4_9_14_0_8_um_filter_36_9]